MPPLTPGEKRSLKAWEKRLAKRQAVPPKLVRRGRRPLIPRVFTPAEAAVILRQSKYTISQWLRRGYLGGFRMGPGYGAWYTTDLDILALMGWPSPGRMPPADETHKQFEKTLEEWRNETPAGREYLLALQSGAFGAKLRAFVQSQPEGTYKRTAKSRPRRRASGPPAGQSVPNSPGNPGA